MTIEITGTEQWQAWDSGVMPPVEQVAGGLWSIPVPIPDNPLRYTLVYALEAAGGLVLVDSGWNTQESWDALCQGIASAGADITDVRAVLVTHYHADHLGLADRIRRASGAWVGMHRLDALRARRTPTTSGQWHEQQVRHLRRHGAPADALKSTGNGMDVERILNLAEPDFPLEDGELIRVAGTALRVVWTPGHTPGHSCFYEPERRMLFSGDHVLPRITPQIAVYGDSDGDPLRDFLLSLERLDGIDVDEVLPAHEYRFRGLRPRVRTMVRHHTERLIELHRAVKEAPGSTAWDLSARLTWSRPWETFSAVSRRFAVGETVAHLTLLRTRGEAAERGTEPVRWYPAPEVR
ncbi:MBL fold metallo-hydrolase [Streptomyces sp. NPDC055078]